MGSRSARVGRGEQAIETANEEEEVKSLGEIAQEIIDLLERTVKRLEKVVGEQEEEIYQLMTKLEQLQGNFSHFHVDNGMNELCALCGLAVINAVHLRSR